MNLDDDRMDRVAAKAFTMREQMSALKQVVVILALGFLVMLAIAVNKGNDLGEAKARIEYLQAELKAVTPTFAMPRCPEDAVLVGTGDFENGRWDAYVCGPAEDSYVSGPWDHVFAEWAESKDGQDTLARWLCTPHTQREWYLTVEPTACGEDE